MLGERHPLKFGSTVHEISCSYGRGVNGGFIVTPNLSCYKSTFKGYSDLSAEGGFKFYDSI